MFRGRLFVCFIMNIVVLGGIFGQDEKNASLYLEAYTDEFQSNFFEGLKQKGIENYDKAINLFLACKEIDATNVVVDFQLADCYSQNKQFLLAQTYGITAVNSAPNNYWYLNMLVEILDKQYVTIRSVEKDIPMEDPKLKENLVLIFFGQKKFEEAKTILNEMKSSPFKQTYLSKISDSIKQKIDVDIIRNEKVVDTSEAPFEIYKRELGILLEGDDIITLMNTSQAALEEYPTQPFFYYSKGVALNRSGNPKEAILALEGGFDFILEDFEMENLYYKELAEAYNLLGNLPKANMYLSKIKSGL